MVMVVVMVVVIVVVVEMVFGVALVSIIENSTAPTNPKRQTCQLPKRCSALSAFRCGRATASAAQPEAPMSLPAACENRCPAAHDAAPITAPTNQKRC
jgi:hypothetical protein